MKMSEARDALLENNLLEHNYHHTISRQVYDLIRTFLRDGYLGLPRFAPFDKILLTAAATEIPQPLKDQLKIGGLQMLKIL